jgi:hypothetical protein
LIELKLIEYKHEDKYHVDLLMTIRILAIKYVNEVCIFVSPGNINVLNIALDAVIAWVMRLAILIQYVLKNYPESTELPVAYCE